MDIQSAGNQQVSVFTLVGSSETECQLPEKEDSTFWNLFAGIIDGGACGVGNFDIRIDSTGNKRVLKQIRGQKKIFDFFKAS